jgi:hypothetical protein
VIRHNCLPFRPIDVSYARVRTHIDHMALIDVIDSLAMMARAMMIRLAQPPA